LENLKGERGISDVLAIAIMFLIAMFAGVLLHSYGADAIPAANSRQLQLKVEYGYKVLELSQVENSSLTYLEAISENLVREKIGSEASMPGVYLRERIDNLLEFIRPSGYGFVLELGYENLNWVQSSPPNLQTEEKGYHECSGKVTLIVGGAGENRSAQISASLKMFRVN